MVINCKSQASPYCQRVGLVSTYFNEIRKYNVLTKEEEKSLLIKAHGKNETEKKQAINRLVTSNQRFVASAAMKYASGDNLLDLVNEGNIGLITAIEKFDLTREVRFITYAAWWIQKSISTYLTQYNNIVTPANAVKLRILTNKAKQEFFVKEQRMPTLDELQLILKEKYNFNVENLSDLESFQPMSIDDTNSSIEDDETLSENPLYTSVTASNNIDDDIVYNDNKVIVKNLLKKLNNRDKYIITKAFGIDCQEETYETIANELNLTKERIRQKVSEIVKKLSEYID